MTVLFLVIAALFAFTGCEMAGYGYVNARTSAVQVVREDHGDESRFMLAPLHRQMPLMHERVPEMVIFYDSHGSIVGSLSSPSDFRPCGSPTILIDERGVRYTKLVHWSHLPIQQPQQHPMLRPTPSGARH